MVNTVVPVVALLATALLSNAQTIDLGYSKVKSAKTFNGITAWKNIRYAAPPIGELRFAAPAAPTTETAVNDGSKGATCPQAAPQNGMTGSLPPTTYAESEDCLLLDVYAPSNTSSTAKLPVMFWIHGGGFTDGVKDDYPGYGLVEASGNKMIFVSTNYRLGGFGFQAGPSFGYDKGIANVGLLDQRAALQWAVDNIEKFGGNPNDITVSGESAGASSIMFQLTANGGQTPLFQKAILQSPAYLPEFQPTYLDGAYKNFTGLVNCTTPLSGSALECLRSQSSDDLIAANKQQISNNPYYGTFVYGPSVDDAFVQAIPNVEILKGHASKIPMLLGFNGNESAIFVNPDVKTEADFNATLNDYLPDIASLSASNTQTFLNNVQRLYPSSAYSSQYARLSALVDEVLVGCNVYTMASFNPTASYVYEFDVGEAHHGSDVLYTFYNSYEALGLTSAALGVTNAKAAETLQSYITSFVLHGTPGFKSYSSSSALSIITDNGVKNSSDPNNNDRCRFWETASYDPDSAQVKQVAANSTATATASSSSSSTSTSTSSVSATAQPRSGASQNTFSIALFVLSLIITL